jgi:hypothetical protein
MVMAIVFATFALLHSTPPHLVFEYKINWDVRFRSSRIAVLVYW